MAKYKNLQKKDTSNREPGYGKNAYLVPLSWLQTHGEPVGDAAVGDSVTIDESHVFLVNRGAIAIYVDPKTVQAAGEVVGELGSKKMAWRPQFTIPGDNPVVYEFVKNILNEEFILFYKEPDCHSAQWIQFGCDCDPVQISAGDFASGTLAEGKKAYNMTGETYCKFFYNGVLQVLDNDVEVE